MTDIATESPQKTRDRRRWLPCDWPPRRAGPWERIDWISRALGATVLRHFGTVTSLHAGQALGDGLRDARLLGNMQDGDARIAAVIEIVGRLGLRRWDGGLVRCCSIVIVRFGFVGFAAALFLIFAAFGVAVLFVTLCFGISIIVFFHFIARVNIVLLLLLIFLLILLFAATSIFALLLLLLLSLILLAALLLLVGVLILPLAATTLLLFAFRILLLISRTRTRIGSASAWRHKLHSTGAQLSCTTDTSSAIYTGMARKVEPVHPHRLQVGVGQGGCCCLGRSSVILDVA